MFGSYASLYSIRHIDYLKYLTGAPSHTFKVSNYSSDDLWDLLENAKLNKHLINAKVHTVESDVDLSFYGFGKGLTMPVLGTLVLFGTDWYINKRFIKMRSMIKGFSYIGPWNKDDTAWANYYSQNPYKDTPSDIFYIEVEDFRRLFKSITINYVHEDYTY